MILCSGLEPGRNGVGDYCRTLAAKLVRLGIECLILALNDHFVKEEYRSDEEDGRLVLVRLPAHFSIGQKSRAIAAQIRDWRPDWISLQFVCYGFHPKGLVFKEIFWLPPLFRGHFLHVMLHELWVGRGMSASRRNVLVGVLQKRLIIRLLRRLQPRVLHTSNYFYQKMLSDCGIKAEVLPLFGSIPVSSTKDEAWLFAAIRNRDGPDLSVKRKEFWLLGLFGGISREWPAEQLYAGLLPIARSAGKSIVVLSAGHAGGNADALFSRWRALFPAINFVMLGPLPTYRISQFFNAIDVGLTSYPLYLLGKSSSTIAMMEHGLPVIASWGDIAPAIPALQQPLDDLVWRCDRQLERRLKEVTTRTCYPGRAAATVRKLLESLS